MPTIEKLIAYLRQHDAYAFRRGNRLYAIETGMFRAAIDAPCVPYTKIVELEPTALAVRIWLGY